MDGATLDLVNAVSGSLGALASTLLVFPLDRAKARLQVGERVADIIRDLRRRRAGAGGGLHGLWHGVRPKALESSLTKFSYFYLYSLLKQAFEARFAGKRTLNCKAPRVSRPGTGG